MPSPEGRWRTQPCGDYFTWSLQGKTRSDQLSNSFAMLELLSINDWSSLFSVVDDTRSAFHLHFCIVPSSRGITQRATPAAKIVVLLSAPLSFRSVVCTKRRSHCIQSNCIYIWLPTTTSTSMETMWDTIRGLGQVLVKQSLTAQQRTLVITLLFLPATNGRQSLHAGPFILSVRPARLLSLCLFLYNFFSLKKGSFWLVCVPCPDIDPPWERKRRFRRAIEKGGLLVAYNIITQTCPCAPIPVYRIVSGEEEEEEEEEVAFLIPSLHIRYVCHSGQRAATLIPMTTITISLRSWWPKLNQWRLTIQ